MQKELKDYSDVELKAISYDNLAQIEQCQSNIKIISQELATRSKKPEVITPEVLPAKPKKE